MLPSTIRKLLRPTVQTLPRLLEIVPPLSRTHLLDHSRRNDSDPIVPSFKPSVSTHPCVYPTFNLGFFLDPKFQAPLHLRPETGIFEEDAADDEKCIIRADSVKKKRKKKMNKHKLRKLRKRLGRKS